MAVLQMQKVSICALKKDRKAILEKIQSMGVMEISKVLDDDSGFERMNTQNERSKFEKNASLADMALDILQEYVPEKVSMFSGLEGKKLIERRELETVAEHKEQIMDIVSDIIGNQKKIAEYRANIQKFENQIEMLIPWMMLDVPMTWKGTKSTELLVGTMPGQMTLRNVQSDCRKCTGNFRSRYYCSFFWTGRSLYCSAVYEKGCGKGRRGFQAERFCQTVTACDTDACTRERKAGNAD